MMKPEPCQRHFRVNTLSTRDPLYAKGTKNGTPRHTPIPSVIMDELKKHREIGNGLLFPSSIVHDKPLDYKKQWAKCLKAANIKNFRWHDMRYDVASTLARDGKTLSRRSRNQKG